MIILTGIALYLFSQLYIDLYRSSSKEFQTLYFAIGMSVAGILAHFIKKHPKVKDKKGQELGWDTIELLMLMATPLVVSFDSLREWYQSNTNFVIIVSTLVFGLWYVISMIRAGRLDQDESKQAFFITALLFGMFLAIIGLASAIIASK